MPGLRNHRMSADSCVQKANDDTAPLLVSKFQWFSQAPAEDCDQGVQGANLCCGPPKSLGDEKLGRQPNLFRIE